MAISDEALRGLRAAVAWNPAGAELLAGILRTLPISVRKKPQDRYGVLSLMLTPQSIRLIGPLALPMRRSPLAPDELQACEVFNREWLADRFSKQELADAIERELAALAPHQRAEPIEPGSLLVFRRGGTTLQGPSGVREIRDPE